MEDKICHVYSVVFLKLFFPQNQQLYYKIRKIIKPFLVLNDLSLYIRSIIRAIDSNTRIRLHCLQALLWKDLTNFIPHFAFGQVSLYVNYFDYQIFFALQSSAENFCKVASHCRGPSKVLERPLQNLQDKLIESPAWLPLVFALEFWENGLIYLNIKMP